MTLLTPSDIPGFLDRFSNFCDSLIVEVSFHFHGKGRDACRLILMGKEETTQSGGARWVRVELEIYFVTDFRLIQPQRTTLQVIGHGIHIVMRDKEAGIEFSGVMEDVASFSQLRQSDAYVMGRELEWRVLRDT